MKALKPVINSALKSFGPLSIFHKASVIGMPSTNIENDLLKNASFQFRSEIGFTDCSMLFSIGCVHSRPLTSLLCCYGLKEIRRGYKFNLPNKKNFSTNVCVCGLDICLPALCPAIHGSALNSDGSSLAPYLGSDSSTIDDILELAGMSQGEALLDIGAGDGRVLIRAIRRGAGRVTGWEINPSVYTLGRAHLDGVLSSEERQRVHFTLTDAMMHIIHDDVDICTLYLLPGGLAMLEPQLRSALTKNKQSFRIITAGWPIPSWQPSEVKILTGGTSLFLYRKSDAHFILPLNALS